MKIGLDLDGVVYPWHYSLVRYFREFKGYEGNDTDFWDMFEAFPKEKQHYYVTLPIHYLDTSPTEDVIIYLPKLAEEAEIYYITARDSSLEYVTRKFLDLYDMPFKENLIFEKNKDSVVRLYGIDYYVDDQPRYLETMKGITIPLLFLQPHNRRGNGRERFECIGGLKQLYDMINSSEKEIEKQAKEYRTAIFNSTMEEVPYDYVQDDFNFDAERERRNR